MWWGLVLVIPCVPPVERGICSIRVAPFTESDIGAVPKHSSSPPLSNGEAAHATATDGGGGGHRGILGRRGSEGWCA